VEETPVKNKNAIRPRVHLDHEIKGIVADARQLAPVDKLFGGIEHSDAYRAAWAWAYESARIAYERGLDDERV